MLYEIAYDYTDDSGYESRNNIDQFDGSWQDLQKYIREMRKNRRKEHDRNRFIDPELEARDQALARRRISVGRSISLEEGKLPTGLGKRA